MLDFIENFATALGVGYYVLVYGVGLIAMALSIIAFQFQKRVTIILSSFFGQSCWVLYFLLQGDAMSAIACALSAIMLAIFAKKDKWKWSTSTISIITFVVIFTVFSVFTFEVWSDIFPLLAGIFAVLANSRTSEKRLRQLSVLWCMFWLLNSTFKMYPVAFANDFLCTVSTIVSLIRYREKRTTKEPKTPVK